MLNHKIKINVTRVVDGDTFDSADVLFDFIDFRVDIPKPRYRLLGVNTPERKMEGYKEATAFTRDKIEGKEVMVEIVAKDVFGRLLCTVYIDGEDTLNKQLLDTKLAVVYKRK